MKKVASNKRSPSVIQYEAGCNALADEFIRKYELSYADMHWVGDNAGDICCIGDWFFSTEAMKVAIDYDFCKGCGICKNICKTGAIGMEAEK